MEERIEQNLYREKSLDFRAFFVYQKSKKTTPRVACADFHRMI